MKSAVDLTRAIKTYADGIDDKIVANINANGSKNILPVTFEDYIKWTTAVVSVPITIENNVITVRGVSWTVNDDGTLSATGTADGGSSVIETRLTNVPDGTYVISGGPSGGSSSTYRNRYIAYFADGTDTGWKYFYEHEEITLQNCVLFRFQSIIYSGYTATNHIVKPMLCTKTDWDLDPTWVPYAKSNKTLTEDSVDWEDIGLLSSANGLPNNNSAKVDSSSGLTFTINDDKSVTVSATSESYPFTVTANATMYFLGTQATNGRVENPFTGKVFKLMGCPSGGSSSTYSLSAVIHSQNGGTGKQFYDTGDGVVVSDSADAYIAVYLKIASGTQLTEALTFKPAIVPPSYNGPYVPYADTNKGLTDRVASVETKIVRIDHIPLVTVKATKSERVQCKIISGQGDIYFAYNGSAWNLNGNAIMNRAMSESVVTITYETSGDTISINCNKSFDGMLISDEPYIEVTFGGTSTTLTNKVPNSNINGLGAFCVINDSVKNTTKTITVSGSMSFLLICTHASETTDFYGAIGAHGSNTIPILIPFVTATGITVATPSTDTITITESANKEVQFALLRLRGTGEITIV